MTRSPKERWVHAASILLAAFLLWLALRGVNWEVLSSTFMRADYRWLLPILFVTLLSHWLRALRWALFLDTVPAVGRVGAGSPPPVSRRNTFVSVMVGYMANYAGPRLGEVIRTANVARQEKRSFSAVLGTVVAERAVDMLTFGLCLATIPLIYADQLLPLWALLTEPVASWLTATPAWILWGAGLGASVLGLSAWYLVWKGLSGGSRLAALADRFRTGLLSVLRTGRTVQVVLMTLAIWICYGFMAWLPFLMLGQGGPFGIGPVDAWGLMLIGAVGVIIPSPGGIGTYHFITIQALALLYGMPQTDAASYALLTHTGQMLLYVAVGFAGMLFLGATFSLSPPTPPDQSSSIES